MKSRFFCLILFIFLVVPFNLVTAQEKPITTEGEETINNQEKLVVVWTSSDREVALKMVFMYTLNAKSYGWWKDITLLVWGPSAKLLSEDQELQYYLKRLKLVGVNLQACKACADLDQVSEELEQLGVEVKYTGDVLTNYIKEGRHVITF
jgi:hypothetical protein